MSEQHNTLTRKELAVMFQYSHRRVHDLWKTILATIPATEMKKEFKTRLPRHYVDAYLGKRNL